MTDNDAIDSSSDEEEMLQGEKSQRPKKLWIKEIMIENGRTRVISKKKSKEKEPASTIEINGANGLTNILEPAPKKINP
ncbi:hypothetical protein T459_01724 [Capsicum annuum]|uniref:Uncharacterized protein n=1 Tax=Capsicum annuum TaxID=4072 RepID=A0A2G3AHX1_CAPAN|nr:hypothetical protein T459_01724 [Capsicum annuum]